MATAIKKKTASKKAKPVSKTKPSAGKAAADPKSTQGKAAKSTKSKPAKSKQADPERSSPAMAEVDSDVLEFIAAIEDFKQANGRPFPSWSEVLLVVRQLGYKRK
jgi:hypothetical protein